MTDTESTVVAIQTLIDAGVEPEEFLRAYHAAIPPTQPDDPSKLAVRIFEYGEQEVDYDRGEWERAVAGDRLEHLVDCDVSDLDTDWWIVDGAGAIDQPYK